MKMINQHTASSINEASRMHGEDNDCTVRAIAVATGRDYNDVHAALRARGRRNRCGAYERQWLPAIKDMGCEYTDVSGFFRGKTAGSIEPELRRSGRKYIIKVTRHAMGYDGEKFIDWAAGSRKRVRNVYLITRPGEVAPKPEPIKLHVDNSNDFVFIIFHTKNNGTGEWRIMINENNKERWLNMKGFEDEARRAGIAAAKKRGIIFIGHVGR